MATFQLNLAKDPTGILVNASYQSLVKPVFLFRVAVEERDANGNVIFGSNKDVHQYFGTGSGSNYLFTHTPSGTNTKTVRANGFYLEVDKLAGSNVITM